MLSLPDDALSLVASFLDLQSQASLSRTCRRWRAVAKKSGCLAAANFLLANLREEDTRVIRDAVLDRRFARKRARVLACRERRIEEACSKALMFRGHKIPKKRKLYTACDYPYCEALGVAACDNEDHDRPTLLCAEHARAYVCERCKSVEGCHLCYGDSYVPNECQGCGAQLCEGCNDAASDGSAPAGVNDMCPDCAEDASCTLFS